MPVGLAILVAPGRPSNDVCVTSYSQLRSVTSYSYVTNIPSTHGGNLDLASVAICFKARKCIISGMPNCRLVDCSPGRTPLCHSWTQGTPCCWRAGIAPSYAGWSCHSCCTRSAIQRHLRDLVLPAEHDLVLVCDLVLPTAEPAGSLNLPSVTL